MKINLLCADRHLPVGVLEQYRNEAWAGIDRGALILVEHGINPVYSVGDFDSVSEHERQQLIEKLDIHPVKAEKDDTDLALGVEQAVAHGYTDIFIYGATGGRLDHFMGALQILLKKHYRRHGIAIKMVDAQNVIQLLEMGRHKIAKDEHFPYISFIPVNGEVVLSLEGFKYNLERRQLEIGSTLTISNEINHPYAWIDIHQEQVLQIRSRDND
ncbi:thiamine diphosphokinase [Staphylococcus sp. HMSC058E03]|uniref:thiamine diphosphokinase n=1 Tax=Staphylococcus sp. HMSC058E03 TaxID=1715054 RepID=UPI0008A8DEF3|nr:thiamine diphosphokinase [Staphylococcus sp. HMSC058E03]OHP07462.1 thiamine pyrophosphokinase [Staphylococcus sp. HMSC058E03]